MKINSVPNEVISSISDKRRLFEILAVLVTGIGKFIFMDLLKWKLPFIIAAIVSWSLYCLPPLQKQGDFAVLGV